jgi:cytoskeletal protein CcmA (bactofilin family)
VQPNFAANDQSNIFAPRSSGVAKLSSERAAVSIIGPDLVITGNLISKGEVQVDGTVQGDIHGSHVIVGPNATINGGIVAEEVVVRGHVSGSVRGKRVMLQASSQVEGDIYHNALSIEQGAMFEGKSRRTSLDPRAGIEPSPLAATSAPRPAAVAPVSMFAPEPAPAPVLAAVASPSEPVLSAEEEASVTIVPPRLPVMR